MIEIFAKKERKEVVEKEREEIRFF